MRKQGRAAEMPHTPSPGTTLEEDVKAVMKNGYFIFVTEGGTYGQDFDG